MNTTINERETKATIENLIDYYGLPRLLEIVSEVCFEKSQHCAENWQDQSLSKQLAKDANKLQSVSAKL